MPFPSCGASSLCHRFEGGYYSWAGGVSFSIAKMPKLEPDEVHVRIYEQRFPQRPLALDPSCLTLGSIHDEDGSGISYLRLRLSTFKEHEPSFLACSEVKPEELKGYELWKELAQGAVFE